MNGRDSERPGKTGPAADNDALRALRESLDTLEIKAGRLGLPLASHLIGVAGLLLVDRLAEETTG